MIAPILAATAFAVSVTLIHIASIALTIRHFRRTPRGEALFPPYPPVSLVRPLCGIDNYAADTLSSTFELDYPRYEVLFCVASAKDPVVPFVEALIAEHPGAEAKLLIGDERVNNNPKLNNVVKGWAAAAYEWIILADSNVLMPPDYVQQLFASWRPDTGLVTSPPVGCRPEGFCANLECAFLNTYQARWQYAADALGFGFAQGKTMLWRRADLDGAGGIAALAKEVAEDAASTKVVRGAGLRVRLVDRPFTQPLGHRTLAEVWNRQLRWARLRRASFLFYFLPEILSGGVLPSIALAFVASEIGLRPLPVVAIVGLFAVLWYCGEMLLSAAADWPISPLSPFYGLIRDLMLPALFVSALRGNDFTWRGNEMKVERIRPRRMMARMRPQRVMARVRPRMQEIAAGGRRRLRALRTRAS
jgi:ceramide glucosyltransferase